MERATFEAKQPHQTPVTNSATFVITSADVGSAAVRAGIAVQLEQERAVLLLAAKLILGRIRGGQIQIGEPYETALSSAIRMVEAGPR